MQAFFPADSYRYPNERLILGLTLFLVLLVIAVTATATVCTGLVFVVAAVLTAYASSRAHHQALMQRALPVTDQTQPQLASLTRQCASRLRPGPVEVYLTRSAELNAYTFGLDSPKVVVLYSSLLQVMDASEMRFIIGHELGHVALGHTRLNSLVGGMAGIPTGSSASAVLTMAFLWWNRTCELSADRAGLLACGDLEKAVTALVKLVAGPAGATRRGLELAYRQIDAEDDTLLGDLGEALSNHPMLIRRITALRKFAGSRQYQRLQARFNQAA